MTPTINSRGDLLVPSEILQQIENGALIASNHSGGKDSQAMLIKLLQVVPREQLVTANLVHFRGNCDARAADEPLHTISAGGHHHGLMQCTLSREHEAGALHVAAFFMRYHSTGGQWADLREPMTTITTADRLALVTVWIGGDPYVIIDIHLRMLQPHELYAAQGFPPSYIIDRGHDGRRLTKSEQVHMCGNSVSPPPMAAIAQANNPWQTSERRAIAA